MQDKQANDLRAMRDASRAYRPADLRGTSPPPERSIFELLKPRAPKDGPPLPDGLAIGWPQFIARGIERLRTEGLKGPYKTIKEKGLGAEIKREIQLITGKK